EVVLVVVLGGGPDRIKRNSDVLLAHAEEPTCADNKRGDLAVAIDQYIHDLADLVVRGVVDVLLVPVGDRHAAGGKGWVDLGGGAGGWRGGGGTGWGACALATVVMSANRIEV